MMACNRVYCSEVGLVWHVKEVKSQDVGAATWNLTSMVGRSGKSDGRST